MLDSWVRYEGQVKQRQQRELAENIIGKITKELENPKNLQQILNQSVADVESEYCRCSKSQSLDCGLTRVSQRSWVPRLSRVVDESIVYIRLSSTAA